MKKVLKNQNIVIYRGPKGDVKLSAEFERDTIWATQSQIADLFGINVRTVSEHFSNIFKTKELEKKSVVRNFRNTATDGKLYDTNFYNLDAVISVGYRVNSKNATLFRIWATKILRQHIIKGYTINRSVVAKNYDNFMDAVEKVKALLPKESKIQSNEILELINLFAHTWFSLDAYDKDTLSSKGATKKHVELTAGKLWNDVIVLKNNLIDKNEATGYFATERERDALAGIVGNVMQSFGGKPLYATIEEKAAHLLYFIVKNHPFVDGNKRTGAYAFIWYLQKAKVLNIKKLTPEALTVITLLVAESDPNHKDKLISLIISTIS